MTKGMRDLRRAGMSCKIIAQNLTTGVLITDPKDELNNVVVEGKDVYDTFNRALSTYKNLISFGTPGTGRAIGTQGGGMSYSKAVQYARELVKQNSKGSLEEAGMIVIDPKGDFSIYENDKRVFTHQI